MCIYIYIYICISKHTRICTHSQTFIYTHILQTHTYIHKQSHIKYTSINTLYDLYNQYITYIYLPKSQEIMNVHSAMHV